MYFPQSIISPHPKLWRTFLYILFCIKRIRSKSYACLLYTSLAKSEDYLTAIFMDDYIGGRYSSVSGVGGAILSLAFGPEVFAQILDGAAAEDKLATNKNILENPDMLDALIGVYERNVQGYPATAVLPYRCV